MWNRLFGMFDGDNLARKKRAHGLELTYEEHGIIVINTLTM